MSGDRQDACDASPVWIASSASGIWRNPTRGVGAIAVALSVCAFCYACYRAYYAVGGEIGMIGRPVSMGQFRAINALGAVVILLAAMLPAVAIRLRNATGRTIPMIGWIAAVGCCMHALVDGILRVLSLTGLHPTQLPSSFWLSFDRRTADLQDLLLNEPWFAIEGLLWAAFAIMFVNAPRRAIWLWSAAAGCVMLTAVGVLTGLGVIGSFHIG